MFKYFLFCCSLVLFSALNAQCVDENLIDPNAICLGIWAPVCGCNGVTYSNSCEAQNQAGLTEWTEGECSSQPQCLDLAEFDFGLCDMWLGFALVNGQCLGLSGCGYTTDNVDYSPFFFEMQDSCTASCQTENPTCQDLADIDFGLCDMALGVALVNGECISLSGCGYVVNEIDYSPYFFESDSICNASCVEIDSCSNLQGIDFGMCSMWLGYAMIDGTCTSLSGCGYIVDNVDYSNAFYEEIDDCLQQCIGIEGCINQWQQNQGQLIDCAFIYNPVCGCDGVTYSNPCEAFFYGGVTSYANGPCHPKLENCQSIPQVIEFGDCEMVLGYAYYEGGCVLTSGCSYVGQNGYDYSEYFFATEYECTSSCINEVELVCVDTSYINLDVLCPAIYQPVCGCDSVTYANSCVATNHFGVTSWTEGECTNLSNDEISRQHISIYPNPSHGLISIVSNQSWPINQISIYDLTGKLIMQQSEFKDQRFELDISEFPNGLYILECIGNDAQIARQPIIRF